MKTFWHIGLFLTLLSLLAGLSACNLSSTGSGPPNSAPWALGEQPTFKGTLVDWAKGDAIAPGTGHMEAITYALDQANGDFLGSGDIAADGGFTFGLARNAFGLNGGLPPDQALCAGLTLSNPEQKLIGVDAILVDALYQDGTHARPVGGVFISLGRPLTAEMQALYSFFYASTDGTVKGACDIEYVGSVPFDLDLRKGWSSVQRDQSGFKTAAIPAGAKWYFINPGTAPSATQP